MPQKPPPPKVRRCPICKSEAVAAYKPFCSKRCADIDLGKWFTDAYVVAGNEDDEDAASGEKPPSDSDEQGS